MRITNVILIAAAMAASVDAQWLPANPVTAVQRQDDGLVLTLQNGLLRLQVCTDSIIHVQYTPTSTFPTLTEYVVTKTAWPAAQWTTQSAGNKVTVTTDKMSASVSREDGAVTFRDKAGKELLSDGPRQMIPAQVN